MPYDKVVDSGALDSGLTGIADAIRAVGGTASDLLFPDGFVAALGSLEAVQFVKTFTVPEDWTTDAKGNTNSIVSAVLGDYTRAENQLYLFRIRDNTYTGDVACRFIVYLGATIYGAVLRKSSARGCGPTASAYMTQGTHIDVYRVTAYPA